MVFKKQISLTVLVTALLTYPISAVASKELGEVKATVDSSKSSGRKALDSKAIKQIEAVLLANEKLHASFFEFDPAKISSAAKSVGAAIGKIEVPELKKLLSFSKSKLEAMTADKSKDELNKDYHLVSMALIHIIKNFDVGDTYNAFSCPMVKMKWVQNTSKLAKVQNPYASNMKQCGSQDTKF